MDTIDPDASSIGEIPAPQARQDSLPIYMDHQASTPLDRRVLARMVEAFETDFGNPNNASHAYGLRSAHSISEAASNVGRLVGAHARNVRFTSGSTEAVRLALGIAAERLSGRKLRVAATAVEHDAVLEQLALMVDRESVVVRWVDVDEYARVDLSDMQRALSEGVDLVVMMAANNEVGTIYPIEAIARMAHEHDAEILVDATQAAGRSVIEVCDWGIEYLVFNAHKIYGPKGIGALVVDDAHWSLVRGIVPHSGTPNPPLASAFGEACRIMSADGLEEERRIGILRDGMQAILRERIPDLIVNGDPDRRLGHNLHVSVPGIVGDAVLAHLRSRVAISTGSACNAGAQETSHVLRAMRLSDDLQEGALRISPGRFTTHFEAMQAAEWIAAAIADVRRQMTGLR